LSRSHFVAVCLLSNKLRLRLLHHWWALCYPYIIVADQKRAPTQAREELQFEGSSWLHSSCATVVLHLPGQSPPPFPPPPHALHQTLP
jgi:hypothetical protein